MKECACCKTKREERELHTTLFKLLKCAARCKDEGYDELYLEYIETLTDHGVVLIFNIFYPGK